MKRKISLSFMTVFILTIVMSFTAFAYGWESDDIGTYYWSNKDNTEWYADGWYWVPVDESGRAFCYYFDSDGYVLKNTDIDGWTVNENGAWVIDNIPQGMWISIPSDYYDVPVSTEGLSNSSLGGKYYYMYSDGRLSDKYLTVSVVDEETLTVVEYSTSVSGSWYFSSPQELKKRTENSYFLSFGGSEEYVFNSDGTLQIYIVSTQQNNGEYYNMRSLYRTYKKADE